MALRVGAELVDEPWAADLAVARAFADGCARGSLDGGLHISSGLGVLSRIETWDHLDALLLAWLVSLDALAEDDDVVVVFPDTRIECALRRQADGSCRASYEDIDGQFDRESLSAAIDDAAARLHEAARRRDCSTPALDRWLARRGRSRGVRP